MTEWVTRSVLAVCEKKERTALDVWIQVFYWQLWTRNYRRRRGKARALLNRHLWRWNEDQRWGESREIVTPRPALQQDALNTSHVHLPLLGNSKKTYPSIIREIISDNKKTEPKNACVHVSNQVRVCAVYHQGKKKRVSVEWQGSSKTRSMCASTKKN